MARRASSIKTVQIELPRLTGYPKQPKPDRPSNYMGNFGNNGLHRYGNLGEIGDTGKSWGSIPLEAMEPQAPKMPWYLRLYQKPVIHWCCNFIIGFIIGTFIMRALFGHGGRTYYARRQFKGIMH